MGLKYEEKTEKIIRTPTLFEGGLFLAGIAVTIIGFYAIHKQYILDGYLSWGLLQGIFLWLLLLVLLILAAIVENVKEELGVIIKELLAEIKLMRKETSLLKECIKRKR
jgi:surface polysaccharide O-acyltransferase-like enzyme